MSQLLETAMALARAGRGQEALALFAKALARNPAQTELWFHKGNLESALGRAGAAVESYTRVLAAAPRNVNTLNNRAVALQQLRRFAEAARDFDAVLKIEPHHRQALGALAICAAQACDWSRREEMRDRLRDAVMAGSADVTPGVLLGYSSNSLLLLESARALARQFPRAPEPLWAHAPFCGTRIRLGYCSADFNAHATARLMVDLFEHHDRTRFELIALDFSEDDKSDIRARLIKCFDQFHPVRRKSEMDIARLIASLKVDIAVDLKGYTGDTRSGLFALRPAPVQVNYLGYPGTMGGDFMDYILGDPVVLPFADQAFYAEKIVQLPDCYQPTDSTRGLDAAPSRAQAGLPETGFVFCCFNNNWKIAPEQFDIWMRLLAATPGSVLWLLEDNEDAARNLRREAEMRGVPASRLIFAPRATMRAHLARHRLADLFLDTLPYCAHTTASDALWAGVPLITTRGGAFQGRVAASILIAAGLPELIAENPEEYESLALALARDPARLTALKAKLAGSRATAPLFDTARFARNLEAAYLSMRDAWNARFDRKEEMAPALRRTMIAP